MKACNGHTREQFRLNSPAHRLQDFLAIFHEGSSTTLTLSSYFPTRMLLVHGIEDDIVPFTATSEAARILRSCGIDQCQEFYAALTGHQDAVIHLMLGGRVNDSVRRWLSNPDCAPLRSKL
jgi:predicted esterase